MKLLVPVTSATKPRMDALVARAREIDEPGMALLSGAAWWEDSTAPTGTWSQEWFIVRDESGDDAGWVSLSHDRFHRSASVGIYLLPPKRSKKLGKIAVLELAQAARARGLHRLEARIDADNVPSRALASCGDLAAIGFKQVAFLRQSKWRGGRYVDQVMHDCVLGDAAVENP